MQGSVNTYCLLASISSVHIAFCEGVLIYLSKYGPSKKAPKNMAPSQNLPQTLRKTNEDTNILGTLISNTQKKSPTIFTAMNGLAHYIPFQLYRKTCFAFLLNNSPAVNRHLVKKSSTDRNADEHKL